MARRTSARLWVLLICAALLGAGATVGVVTLGGCAASRVHDLEFQQRQLAAQRDALARRRAGKAEAPAATLAAPAGPPAARPTVTEAPPAHGGTATVNAAAYDAMFFKHYGVNPFIDTDDDRFSTFAMDVDTGSYTLCRSYLAGGHLPPAEAVRVEEFVNYFKYRYRTPDDGAFAIHVDGAESPFGGPKYKLIRIGIQARRVAAENRKPAALTFVIDTSGSMNRENRLGTVKKALHLLVEQLAAGDKIAIVEYGSDARVVLQTVPASERGQILEAIGSLRAGGATNAEAGLKLGYELAGREPTDGVINRVILCSDGVANVGRTSAKQILEQVRHQADRGVTLSAIGFGMGNYNDVLMEQIADKGNGHYAYVDSLAEARRVFVENLTGTLQVVARDAKVQVEFNPKTVSRFRLLGYENRRMARRDFRDDTKDAGEVGSNHAVTALYEVKLTGTANGKLASVFLRYKDPETREVTELRQAISVAAAAQRFADAPWALRLAAVVAEFAEVLRGSYWAKDSKPADLLALARPLERDSDNDPDVKELVGLIAKAARLKDSHEADEPGRPGRPEDPSLDG
jgi:Ca-activated chloride channel family protein